MKCHPWNGLTSPKCSQVGENSQVNRKRKEERREGEGLHNKEEEEELEREKIAEDDWF